MKRRCLDIGAISQLLALTLLVSLFAAACGTSKGKSNATARSTENATAAATPGIVKTNANGGCPVTIPTKQAASDTNPGNYGNGKLWVDLPADGVLPLISPSLRPANGLWVKMPWWWTATLGPKISIGGHRLDGASAPLSVDARGASPAGFQATYLGFPTPGCWQVTGRVGKASLTFVGIVSADTSGQPPASQN